MRLQKSSRFGFFNRIFPTSRLRFPTGLVYYNNNNDDDHDDDDDDDDDDEIDCYLSHTSVFW